MDEAYRTQKLITCIGNKRKLLPFIEQEVLAIKKRLGRDKLSFFDGFSGSGAVARMFKAHADMLYVNDLEDYSRVCNECFLASPNAGKQKEIEETIRWLNEWSLTPKRPRGFIEELYAPADDAHVKPGERVFYTNENAKIIDNVRRKIDGLSDPKFYLAPLLVKASIHCNTSGVFKGFHKKNGIGHFGGKGENALSRIKGRIVLEPPVFSEHQCYPVILQGDVNLTVEGVLDVDVAYYDPPYNQHPYGSNYFMLNLIANYKRPDVKGVSGIPNDWNRSAYNKRTAVGALEDLIAKTRAKFILLSYNNEGIIPEREVRLILERYGSLELRTMDYETYRGSRNLRNRSLQVKELLWVLETK
jgi:adenine-specific DNA-methyltransferase